MPDCGLLRVLGPRHRCCMPITTTTTTSAPAAPTTDGSRAPGVLLCLLGAGTGLLVSRVAPVASPLLVAIVLGAVLANLRPLPQLVQPGLKWSGMKLLRAGIVLLGLQLSLGDIVGLGAGMILVVLAVVVVGITATMAIGQAMGVSWSQRLLIACGFSICGAAAVAAADGVIEADEEEVATSIALVVIFGTLMIPVLPFLAHLVGFGERAGGLWAGVSIHEVAQVVAAGGVIGSGALGVAVIAKLARVLMLAPVMAVIGWQQRRRAAGEHTGTGSTVKLPPLVPVFVLGFLAMVVVRSVGFVPEQVQEIVKLTQTALLAAAMFALGCGVRVASMRRVGPKPFLLAAAATVVVATTGLGGVLLFG